LSRSTNLVSGMRRVNNASHVTHPPGRSIRVAHFFGDGKNLCHNTINIRIGGTMVNDTSA
jgi:hypothetical protein